MYTSFTRFYVKVTDEQVKPSILVLFTSYIVSLPLCCLTSVPFEPCFSGLYIPGE